MALNPSWTPMYPPAATQKVVASNDDAYALHTDGSYSLYAFQQNSWYTGNTPTAARFVGLSAADDHTVMGYAEDGTSHINIYGFWYPIYAGYTIGAATGGASTYMVAEDSGKIRTYIHGSINTISVYGGPTKLSATTNLSEMWGVDDAGTVYRWDPSSTGWASVPGMLLKHISVSLSPSSGTLRVFGVNSDGFGVHYDPSTNYWEQVYGPGVTTLATLEVSGNTLWAVTSAGDVYKGSI